MFKISPALHPANATCSLAMTLGLGLRLKAVLRDDFSYDLLTLIPDFLQPLSVFLQKTINQFITLFHIFGNDIQWWADVLIYISLSFTLRCEFWENDAELDLDLDLGLVEPGPAMALLTSLHIKSSQIYFKVSRSKFKVTVSHKARARNAQEWMATQYLMLSCNIVHKKCGITYW